MWVLLGDQRLYRSGSPSEINSDSRSERVWSHRGYTAVIHYRKCKWRWASNRLTGRHCSSNKYGLNIEKSSKEAVIETLRRRLQIIWPHEMDPAQAVSVEETETKSIQVIWVEEQICCKGLSKQTQIFTASVRTFPLTLCMRLSFIYRDTEIYS